MRPHNKNIVDLLACPVCKAPLAQSEGRYFCVPPVESGREAHTFETIQGTPIFVDFEKSILDLKELRETLGAPQVARREGALRSWIKDHMLRPKAVRQLEQNTRNMANRLKKRENPTLLVVGGGTSRKGNEIFYDDPGIDVIGFDIYRSPLCQFIADAHSIPLKSNTVDGILIEYVLEHVLDPRIVVKEAWRVLKDDGLIYSETPFLQPVHEGAFDFTRFTHSGHRWLFRDFEEIASGVAMGPGVHLISTIDHLARGVFQNKKIGKGAKLLFAVMRLIEKIIPVRYHYDSASSCFFLGVKSHRAMKPGEMAEYYKGGQ